MEVQPAHLLKSWFSYKLIRLPWHDYLRMHYVNDCLHSIRLIISRESGSDLDRHPLKRRRFPVIRSGRYPRAYNVKHIKGEKPRSGKRWCTTEQKQKTIQVRRWEKNGKLTTIKIGQPLSSSTSDGERPKSVKKRCRKDKGARELRSPDLERVLEQFWCNETRKEI